MKVMILCGGKGTRIRAVSELVPKPMVPVGDRPILWHVMKAYSQFGFNEFVLCLGFKGMQIKRYFLEYFAQRTDVSVNTRTGQVRYHGGEEREDWEVTLADTGLETMTAGRVKRAMRYVEGDEFMLTYADGLCSLDLNDLLAHHRAQAKLATITAVHPAGRFGELDLASGSVLAFNEKPQTSQGHINGGYMVLSRAFVDQYVSDDPTIPLEQAPLQSAARDGELAAYVHDGWWQCMDTAREYETLNALWASGEAPWVRGQG